ncbi:hypothetical protein [Clostridium sp.]|uniref:hypothetical protein n=1 Tax=Clostridium sp. TaxID=1506 RepID=UPI002FC5D328
MDNIDYRDNDDLFLYDSVIESLEVNHKDKSVIFHILKVIHRIDREHGFTYKVKSGILAFTEVLYANIPYSMEFGEWSEFYRSAILDSSELLEKIKKRSNPAIKKIKEQLKHVYLGVDNGDVYNEINIICSNFYFEFDSEEFILHDDFEWLYDE